MSSLWSVFRMLPFCCVIAAGLSAQTAPLSTIDEVLAAFLEANGGEEGVEAVRSIRARGSIMIDGKSHQLTLLKKRPNLKRITLRKGDFLIHRGFDGNVSWLMAESENGHRRLRFLEGEEKERFEYDQFMLGLLFLGEEEGVEHVLSDVEYVGRIPTYVVDSTYLGLTRRAYIDTRTLRVIEFHYALDDDEGSTVVEILSDYTRIGSVWIAQRSERQVNGELEGVIELDRIEVNNGVFGTVFDVPQVDELDEDSESR